MYADFWQDALVGATFALAWTGGQWWQWRQTRNSLPDALPWLEGADDGCPRCRGTGWWPDAHNRSVRKCNCHELPEYRQ